MTDKELEVTNKGSTNEFAADAQMLIEQRNQIEALEAENKKLKEAKTAFYDKFTHNIEQPKVEVRKQRTVDEVRADWLAYMQKPGAHSGQQEVLYSIEIEDITRAESNGQKSSYWPNGNPRGITNEDAYQADRFYRDMKEALTNAGADLLNYKPGSELQFETECRRLGYLAGPSTTYR